MLRSQNYSLRKRFHIGFEGVAHQIILHHIHELPILWRHRNKGLSRLCPTIIALVIVLVQFYTLRAVCIGITIQLELQAGLGTVCPNQRHLFTHLVLPAKLLGLEILAQSIFIVSPAEQ
jgi:hypothetical protein